MSYIICPNQVIPAIARRAPEVAGSSQSVQHSYRSSKYAGRNSQRSISQRSSHIGGYMLVVLAKLK